MGEARNGAWETPMAEAPGSPSAETRAIRAAVEAARRANLTQRSRLGLVEQLLDDGLSPRSRSRFLRVLHKHR
jgi:hypothetical protein